MKSKIIAAIFLAVFVSVFSGCSGTVLAEERLFPFCDPDTNRYGLKAADGKVLIEAKFEDAKAFSEGLLPVMTGKKWGFVDRDGKFAIEPQYENAGSFSDGLAGVRRNGKWGAIDKSGKTVVDFKYDMLCEFSEGLAVVINDNKYGYVGKDGNLVIAMKFKTAWTFSCGLAVARNEFSEPFGYIDKKGDWAIAPKFDHADYFKNGYAKVRQGSAWGVINTKGDFTIPARYDDVTNFSEGVAAVRYKGGWYFITEKGEGVVKKTFDQVGEFNEGFAPVRIAEKWGYLGKNGKMLAEAQFDSATIFIDGTASVTLDEKKGVIDRSGVVRWIESEPAGDDKAPPQIESTKLAVTSFSPVLDAKIVQGKNFIYCSTFQLAWKYLCSQIIGGPVKMEGDPENAEKLNVLIGDDPVVSDDAYFALAGFGRDAIASGVNDGLKAKFGSRAPTVALSVGADEILAFAYLFKNLEFKKEFETIKSPIEFTGANGKKTKIASFGIDCFSEHDKDQKKMSRQLEISYYDHQKGFIIRLSSKSASDEIVISTVPPRGTLKETFENIAVLIKNGSPADAGELDNPDKTICDRESFRMPKIDFNILHFFTEVQNHKILNETPALKDGKSYIIGSAAQSVRFRLCEKGALLESLAFGNVFPTAVPKYHPRDLTVKGPFFVYLKDISKPYPYFMMYVDNDELLIKK